MIADVHEVDNGKIGSAFNWHTMGGGGRVPPHRCRPHGSRLSALPAINFRAARKRTISHSVTNIDTACQK